MDTNFSFSSSAWNYNNTRLVNQIFKLLPMYENDEDWHKQLKSIILELKGYNSLFKSNPNFMTLVVKLYSLESVEDKFSFRKCVFESITLLKETKL